MSAHGDPRVVRVVREVMTRLETRTRSGSSSTSRGLPGVRGPAGPRTTPGPITAIIDHTLLRPEAERDDILRLVQEARAHRFATVCVNPWWVPLAAQRLRGSGVKVAAVVGFPLGAMHPAIKAFEAGRVHALGADEIDMVVNQGELIAGRLEEVVRDVAGVRRSIGAETTLKVILETGRLDERQIRAGARAAVEAGCDYLKTSTGFGAGGATVEAVQLLREVAGAGLGVKASGGIRSLADARAMVAAGATRLGTSAGVAIAAEERDPTPASALPTQTPARSAPTH